MKYSIAHLGESLKKARQTKKLSQRDLSHKTGITQSQISKFENGAVDLQVSSLIELARGLDLEPMLVPRALVPVIEGLQRKNPHSIPMYRLDDEEENTDD